MSKRRIMICPQNIGCYFKSPDGKVSRLEHCEEEPQAQMVSLEPSIPCTDFYRGVSYFKDYVLLKEDRPRSRKSTLLKEDRVKSKGDSLSAKTRKPRSDKGSKCVMMDRIDTDPPTYTEHVERMKSGKPIEVKTIEQKAKERADKIPDMNLTERAVDNNHIAIEPSIKRATGIVARIADVADFKPSPLTDETIVPFETGIPMKDHLSIRHSEGGESVVVSWGKHIAEDENQGNAMLAVLSQLGLTEEKEAPGLGLCTVWTEKYPEDASEEDRQLINAVMRGKHE